MQIQEKLSHDIRVEVTSGAPRLSSFSHPIFVATAILRKYKDMASALLPNSRGVPAAMADNDIPGNAMAVRAALDVLSAGLTQGIEEAVRIASLHWRICCANSVPAKENAGEVESARYLSEFAAGIARWRLALQP